MALPESNSRTCAHFWRRRYHLHSGCQLVRDMVSCWTCLTEAYSSTFATCRAAFVGTTLRCCIQPAVELCCSDCPGGDSTCYCLLCFLENGFQEGYDGVSRWKSVFRQLFPSRDSAEGLAQPSYGSVSSQDSPAQSAGEGFGLAKLGWQKTSASHSPHQSHFRIINAGSCKLVEDEPNWLRDVWNIRGRWLEPKCRGIDWLLQGAGLLPDWVIKPSLVACNI